MNDSYISASDSHTTFAGPDATRLYAALALRSAIDLYLKCGMKVNRAYTPTAMVVAAGRYSGKSYKRGKIGMQQASADLTAWIDAMKAALPVILS